MTNRPTSMTEDKLQQASRLMHREGRTSSTALASGTAGGLRDRHAGTHKLHHTVCPMQQDWLPTLWPLARQDTPATTQVNKEMACTSNNAPG